MIASSILCTEFTFVLNHPVNITRRSYICRFVGRQTDNENVEKKERSFMGQMHAKRKKRTCHKNRWVKTEYRRRWIVPNNSNSKKCEISFVPLRFLLLSYHDFDRIGDLHSPVFNKCKRGAIFRRKWEEKERIHCELDVLLLWKSIRLTTLHFRLEQAEKFWGPRFHP